MFIDAQPVALPIGRFRFSYLLPRWPGRSQYFTQVMRQEGYCDKYDRYAAPGWLTIRVEADAMLLTIYVESDFPDKFRVTERLDPRSPFERMWVEVWPKLSTETITINFTV